MALFIGIVTQCIEKLIAIFIYKLFIRRSPKRFPGTRDYMFKFLWIKLLEYVN